MMPSTPDIRTLEVEDRQDVPLLSIVLGYGPMLPFVAGALLVWFGPQDWTRAALHATLIWGCAILCFLAGVRRGVSFRMPHGPTVTQIVTMFVLFCLGLAALFAYALRSPTTALILLAIGYGGIGVLDPIAARHGEAPGFFSRLRPYQMAIPVVFLLALIPAAAVF